MFLLYSIEVEWLIVLNIEDGVINLEEDVYKEE